MSRVVRTALVAESVLLLGLTVAWAFREYVGAGADSVLAAAPLRCPFHLWR